MVLFAHLADCHLGAWRDPKMHQLVLDSFTLSVDKILARNVDFVLIAGDLFNTALPGIDVVKHAVRQLGRLKKNNIPVYFIAGSHDYSPTGKTMLDVIEEAGLAFNVCKPSITDDVVSLKLSVDDGTGVAIAGVLGKAGQLDRVLYEKLVIDGDLPEKSVFLFHTALEELKPKDKNVGATHPVSFLPKGFSYYAGGHVHIIESASLPGYSLIAYPGPLFPASFSELEELRVGGFNLVTLGDDVSVERVKLPIKNVVSVSFDVSGKDPDQVFELVNDDLSSREVEDSLIVVRLRGVLVRGGAADVSFRQIFDACRSRGAYCCMKNTVAVRSPQLAEIESVADSPDDIESILVSEHAGSIELPGVSKSNQQALIEQLIASLSQEQNEETKKKYQERVLEQTFKLLDVSD